MPLLIIIDANEKHFALAAFGTAYIDCCKAPRLCISVRDSWEFRSDHLDCSVAGGIIVAAINTRHARRQTLGDTARTHIYRMIAWLLAKGNCWLWSGKVVILLGLASIAIENG